MEYVWEACCAAPWGVTDSDDWRESSDAECEGAVGAFVQAAWWTEEFALISLFAVRVGIWRSIDKFGCTVGSVSSRVNSLLREHFSLRISSAIKYRTSSHMPRRLSCSGGPFHKCRKQTSPTHSILVFVARLAGLPTTTTTPRTPASAITNRGSVLGGSGVAGTPVACVLVDVRVEVVSAGVRQRAASDSVTH